MHAKRALEYVGSSYVYGVRGMYNNYGRSATGSVDTAKAMSLQN